MILPYNKGLKISLNEPEYLYNFTELNILPPFILFYLYFK
jgi:hypothetical protein